MKNPSLSGYVAFSIYILALVLVFIAFFSTSWIVSDKQIIDAKLDKFGLWTYCFRSLPHLNDTSEQSYLVGCHWIFNPFTEEYNEIEGFLLPHFILATQFFYTIAFMGTSMSTVGSFMYFLCYTPRENHFIPMTFVLGVTLTVSGICAGIAVFIFALFVNYAGWMPEHESNYFGWTFGVVIASFIALLTSGALYLQETNIQTQKINILKIP